MPLRGDMQLVSTDDHLIEHPAVWSTRLAAADRAAGPRIVEERQPSGRTAQVWEYQAERYRMIGLNAVAGKAREDYGTEPTRFDEMRVGCYDPVARIDPGGDESTGIAVDLRGQFGEGQPDVALDERFESGVTDRGVLHQARDRSPDEVGSRVFLVGGRAADAAV